MQKERMIGYSVVRGRYKFNPADVEKILRERFTEANPGMWVELPPVCPPNPKK
jgi:hypothetical protein